jgi:hypothetical protein
VLRSGSVGAFCYDELVSVVTRAPRRVPLGPLAPACRVTTAWAIPNVLIRSPNLRHITLPVDKSPSVSRGAGQEALLLSA